MKCLGHWEDTFREDCNLQCPHLELCLPMSNGEADQAIVIEQEHEPDNDPQGCIVIIGEAESHEDIKEHYSKYCFGEGTSEMGGCGLSCYMSGGPAHLCIAYNEARAQGAIAIEYEEDTVIEQTCDDPTKGPSPIVRDISQCDESVKYQSVTGKGLGQAPPRPPKDQSSVSEKRQTIVREFRAASSDGETGEGCGTPQ